MVAKRPVDQDELRRLHEQGWGSGRIAAHFRVTSERVRQIRHELGLKPHDSRLAPEVLAALEAANATFKAGGVTIAEAARRHDVGPNQLRSWRTKRFERSYLAESPSQSASRKADAAVREHTLRLIAAYDRRRALAGGVVPKAGA